MKSAFLSFVFWVQSLFKPTYLLLDVFIEMLGESMVRRGISHEIHVRQKKDDIYIVATKVIFEFETGPKQSRTFLTEFKQGKTKDRQIAKKYCKSYVDVFLQNIIGYCHKHHPQTTGRR